MLSLERFGLVPRLCSLARAGKLAVAFPAVCSQSLSGSRPAHSVLHSHTTNHLASHHTNILLWLGDKSDLNVSLVILSIFSMRVKYEDNDETFTHLFQRWIWYPICSLKFRVCWTPPTRSITWPSSPTPSLAPSSAPSSAPWRVRLLDMFSVSQIIASDENKINKNES